MQLTQVEALTSIYTQNDLREMVEVMHSSLSSVPSSIIRWGQVDPVEAQTWLRTAYKKYLDAQFQQPHITAMPAGHEPPSQEHAEHLVIRDLDLQHTDPQDTQEPKGRVVAHADYRYTPSFRGPVSSSQSQPQPDPTSFPAGLNIPLHTRIDTEVEATLQRAFTGLPCFELRGISTLSPSHLRKGIATKLVEWVFPYADRFAVPVVLAASPLGLHVYRKCGFEEYRSFDVVVGLERYGGEGVHEHVLMVRWPRDVGRLSPAWMEWREVNGKNDKGL